MSKGREKTKEELQAERDALVMERLPTAFNGVDVMQVLEELGLPHEYTDAKGFARRQYTMSNITMNEDLRENRYRKMKEGEGHPRDLDWSEARKQFSPMEVGRFAKLLAAIKGES